MYRTDKENREFLRGHELPELLEGKVTEVRYRLSQESWYAKVDEQWYWLDARQGITPKWLSSQFGPSL